MEGKDNLLHRPGDCNTHLQLNLMNIKQFIVILMSKNNYIDGQTDRETDKGCAACGVVFSLHIRLSVYLDEIIRGIFFEFPLTIGFVFQDENINLSRRHVRNLQEILQSQVHFIFISTKTHAMRRKALQICTLAYTNLCKQRQRH